MSTNTGMTLKKIDELCEALSSLLTEDVTDLPAAVQLACLQALQPAVCQIQVLQLRLVGAVDANASPRTHGSASTATWLRNTLHVPKATEMVRSAAALSRMPIVSAAFAAGEINDAHLATIAKVAEALPPQALADGAEELLVRQASQLTPSKFVSAAGRIRDQVAPRSASPVERPPTRWLRTDQRSDGRVQLRGMLDPDSGRLLLDALFAATSTAAPLPGDETIRRADALVALCHRAMLVFNERRTNREPAPSSVSYPATTSAPGEPGAPRTPRVGRRPSVTPAGAKGYRRASRSQPTSAVDSDQAQDGNAETAIGADRTRASGTSQKRSGARQSAKPRRAKSAHRRGKHQRLPSKA